MAAPFKERKPIQIDEEYPDYGEEVLNRLVGPMASAKLPQVSQLSRPQPEIVRTTSQKNQGSTLSTIAKRACRDSIRIAVFILLLMVLYSWNVRLFKLGDTQKVISQDEKCTTINRFDFTSKSWNEELTLNNLGNVYHQKQICDNYKSEFSQLMRNGVLKAAKGIKRILGDEED